MSIGITRSCGRMVELPEALWSGLVKFVFTSLGRFLNHNLEIKQLPQFHWDSQETRFLVFNNLVEFACLVNSTQITTLTPNFTPINSPDPILQRIRELLPWETITSHVVYASGIGKYQGLHCVSLVQTMYLHYGNWGLWSETPKGAGGGRGTEE